ncbi:uncharacterized protein LOC134665935 [Cydia fagiglandana]|uniref:uncharacterized protein LOC134665935 n=1 Tax=Cydia fagiglandana TaxID=1458189 RepID=UPI002FEE074F
MFKITVVLGALLIVFVVESTSQRIILPTYRPLYRPTLKPIIPNIILPIYRPPRRDPNLLRYARAADDTTPSETVIPNLASLHNVKSSDSIVPDTHQQQYREISHRSARSVDSPDAKRGGGSPKTSGSRDNGPPHPDYNRRNARDIKLPGLLNTHQPKSIFPRPSIPGPVTRTPILARTARDIQIPEIKKPTHRDVIIPNWNPHVKSNPWDSLGGRRHRRSLDVTEEIIDNNAYEAHSRLRRSPKKKPRRVVIIIIRKKKH